MSVRLIGTQQQDVDVTSLSSSLAVIQYDLTGNPYGPAATFDYASVAWTPPATPTDLWGIQNGGTNTIAITRFRLSGVQTTAGVNSWYLIRRRTPNIGGTISLDAVTNRDTSNVTPTALISRWTANPTTVGAIIGNVRTAKVLSLAPAGTGANDQWIWDFDDFQTNPIILRGYGHGLYLNFNGAALPAGLSVHVSCTWTEE